MENKKTIAYLNGKTWYRTLKVINALFVIFMYLVGAISCISFLWDGQDNIAIFLKIILTIVLAFLFWVISKTPQEIFYSLWGAERTNYLYSKTILVLGILSLIILGVIVVTVVLPFGYNTKEFTITNASQAGSPQFIQTLADLTNSPAQVGDTVIPIDSVDQFLPTLLNEINNASVSINFTTFAWADGPFSDQVFSALIKAAERGVQVRLLLDALGSHNLSQNKITLLENAGGIVKKYHEFNILDPLQYDSRDHMRAIVFDGKIGFTGGMGITDDWLGNTPAKTYEDMMFEFKGAMAQSIQNTFNENWSSVTGEVLSGPAFYPPVSSPSTATKNTFVGITSIPSEDYQPVREAFMLTILSAQKSLYIVNPYIVPDQGLLKALEDKARAGVDVRIISPGPISNAPLVRAAWHKDYEPLLLSGVKIYEYQSSMIHTKFMLADGEWSLIGSANIDNRSESLNNENVMGIDDSMLANNLHQIFTKYLSQSKEITITDWKKQYGFLSKLYSEMLLVLFKQY